MEQDVNVMMEQFKQSVVDLVNHSGLPLGVVRYIFNDINSEIQYEYNKYIQQKQQEMIAAQQAAAAQVEEVVDTPVEDETV